MRQTSDTLRPPWLRVATVAILVLALVIAATGGRTVEAAIIGVLLVFPLAFLGLWLVEWRRERSE